MRDSRRDCDGIGPVALQHAWALRVSGGSVREVAGADPTQVTVREFVFAVPLDVMGNLARKLTEVYERQSGTTL